MRRLYPDRHDAAFIRRLAILFVSVALVVFIYRISDILILLFGGTLGAILLSAAADWIDGHTFLPRAVGLVLATLTLLSVLGLIGWLFGTAFSQQAGALSQTLPADWAHVRAMLEANPIGHLLVDSFRQGSQGSRFAHLLLGAGWSLAEVFANLLIILIGAVFLAAQPGVYRKGLLLLAPRPYRGIVADVLHDTGRSLRLWLVTQLISMIMMGLMIGLGLWWSGLDTPAALGLLGGLSEFIPYIGPTLAMIPAIVMALAGKGSLAGVLLTYAFVRIVQVQIITPLISQQMVSVPPGLYLFMILAFGVAFGGFGMFFAGALSVAAYTLVIRLYERETLDEDVDLPGE